VPGATAACLSRVSRRRGSAAVEHFAPKLVGSDGFLGKLDARITVSTRASLRGSATRASNAAMRSRSLVLRPIHPGLSSWRHSSASTPSARRIRRCSAPGLAPGERPRSRISRKEGRRASVSWRRTATARRSGAAKGERQHSIREPESSSARRSWVRDPGARVVAPTSRARDASAWILGVSCSRVGRFSLLSTERALDQPRWIG
jgi:hypothetical protein